MHLMLSLLNVFSDAACVGVWAHIVGVESSRDQYIKTSQKQRIRSKTLNSDQTNKCGFFGIAGRKIMQTVYIVQ